MKLSESKLALAKVINEKGGWVDGAKFSSQDRWGNTVCFYSNSKPKNPLLGGLRWRSPKGTGYMSDCDINASSLIINWHQTILSREEYYLAYPKADAEAKLAEMVAAGKAIDLVLSAEHEVSVITPALPPIIPGDLMSWHQWEVGDFISWSIVGHSGAFRIISVHHDPSRNIGDFDVVDKRGDVYEVYGNECRFIRRP